MAFNQTRYISQYNKEKYRMYQFRVRKSDSDIINALDSISNKNEFILNLIKKEFFSDVLTIRQIKQIIIPVLAGHGISEIYLFGSYSRGEATAKSDIDIYCDQGNIKTLIEQVSLKKELENACGKRVDLVFIGSEMSAYFKRQLEGDMIRLC